MYIEHSTNFPNLAVSLESSALTGPHDSPAVPLSTGVGTASIAGGKEQIVRLFFYRTRCQTASFSH